MSLIIKTKHLYLRLLKQEDLGYLTKLDSDADVRRFFPDGTQNKEQTKVRMDELISYYETNGLPGFAMFWGEAGEFVGRCGFALTHTGEIEVGYLLHKKFWGKGYASEALAALLEWSKIHIKADYIIAFAPEDHIASQRVMHKGGMQYYKKDVAHGVLCSFYRIEN